MHWRPLPAAITQGRRSPLPAAVTHHLRPTHPCTPAPPSIRALYGTNGTRNAAHGSDSAASADREAAFFFPALPPLGGAPALRGDEAAAYITAMLQPTLVTGLTALAKAKPSSKPVSGARGPRRAAR